MPTPRRSRAHRETTLAAEDKLADHYTRSASDVAEAALRFTLHHSALGPTGADTFGAWLAALAPLQPTQGTGRRARRASKNS